MARPRYIEQQVASLYQHAEVMRDEVRLLQDSHNALTALVNQVLYHPALRYGGRRTGLEHIVAGLRERVDIFSQQMTQRRDDHVRKDYLVHDDIARRLESLVTQNLVNFAMQLLGDANDGEEVAQIVENLSDALFSPETRGLTIDQLTHWLEPDLDPPLPELMRLRAIATELIRSAEDSGHDCQWSFHGHEEPYDQERQQLWPGSADDGGTVSIVVAPGTSSTARSTYASSSTPSPPSPGIA